jgi:hypothetical protein
MSLQTTAILALRGPKPYAARECGNPTPKLRLVAAPHTACLAQQNALPLRRPGR